MKPAPFEYIRAVHMEHCLELLAAYGDEARLLAGGQSLVPSLALRLQAPAALIDINRIDELAVPPLLQSDGLRLSAMTRHAALMTPAIQQPLPLLGLAAPWIAHSAIRHRGTLGGNLSLGDPASELPACVIALDATIVLNSHARGERRVKAADFYRGLFDNARKPEELITACEFPRHGVVRSAFREVARRKGDYATAGIAAIAHLDAGAAITHARVVFFGIGDRPLAAPLVAQAIAQAPTLAEATASAQSAFEQEMEPQRDVWHSAATKSHICKTLLKEIVHELRSGQ